MKPILFSLLLTICFSSVTRDHDALDPTTKRLLEQAAKNGKGVTRENFDRSPITYGNHYRNEHYETVS